MKLNKVGNSGLMVSVVGLGCNNFGRKGAATEEYEGSKAVIHAALDAGITFFDTANNYGKEPGLSERFLGRALEKQRKNIVLATKFGMPAGGTDFGARGSRSYIIRAVEASLKRLKTDWIDLYQFHTPDPITPIEETLAALGKRGCVGGGFVGVGWPSGCGMIFGYLIRICHYAEGLCFILRHLVWKTL